MITFEIEMTNTKYTYYKGNLTKWLLTVALFFSIISFAGYASNYNTSLQQVTKTERVLSNKIKTYKRTITFKNAFAYSLRKNSYSNTYKDWKNALIVLDCLSKVKADDVARKFNLYIPYEQFRHVKTIPQSSKEDLFVPCIG
jgi:hypothetical protein